MNKLLGFGNRYPLITLLFLLLVTGLSLFQIPGLQIEATAEGMMVKDDPARKFYEDSLRTFGTENVTIIYIQDDKLHQRDKLLAIQKAVNKLNASPLVHRTVSLFSIRHVRTEDGFTYTNPYLKRIPKDENKIKDILAAASQNPLVQHNLLSTDGKAMAVNVFLDTSDYHRGFDEKADQLINSVIEPLRQKVDEVFYVGDPYVRVGITERIHEDQETFIPIAIILLIITLALLLRQPKAAVVPLITASISIAWILGLMAFLDIPVNIMTSVVPALLIIIGSTEDIHLIAEYLSKENAGQKTDIILERLSRSMGMAVLLTFISTYVGFLSIAASRLELLQQFGLVASTGLIANFLVTVLLVPMLLKLLKFKVPEVSAAKSNTGLIERIAEKITRLTIRYRRWVVGLISIVVLVAAYYAMQVRVNNNFMDYFDEDSTLVRHANLLHENLSGIQSLSIVVSGQDGAFLEIENLQQIWNLQEYMKAGGYFDSSYSFADFIGVVHAGLNDWSAIAYLPERKEIVEEYMSLLDTSAAKSFVSEDFSQTRILVRHHMTSSEQINQAVEVINQYALKNISASLQVVVTGENYLNSQAGVYMVEGQYTSLAIVLFVIFLTVSFLFMNTKAGSIAVIANAFPVVILFGVMGFFDIPINTGTAMVAAISLGICVDYSMHFMARFNRLAKTEKNVTDALIETARQESTPIFSTALALAAGFYSFSLSDFPPVARFGELSAMIMMLALVSTFVLTVMMLMNTRLITVWDVMTKTLKDRVLKESDLFSGMSRWQAKKIMAMTEIREYDEHEAILLQGQQVNNLFVLLDGEIEGWRTRSDGSSYSIGVSEPGAVFGIMFPDSGQLCFSDMVALSKARVLKLKWSDIDQISRYFPRLSLRLHKNISSIVSSLLRFLENRVIHTYDELSGAYGARIFLNLLETMMGRALRYDEPLSVLRITFQKNENLDKREKNILDRNLGQAIQSAMRKPDVFGRLAEDNFFIACPNSTKANASILMERILQKLGNSVFIGYSVTYFQIDVIEVQENETFEQFTSRVISHEVHF